MPIAPQAGSLVVPTMPATQHTELVASAAQSQVNPAYAAIDANSDTVGDLAIAKFKCDCPACRVAVVQLLQTGQLSL